MKLEVTPCGYEHFALVARSANFPSNVTMNQSRFGGVPGSRSKIRPQRGEFTRAALLFKREPD